MTGRAPEPAARAARLQPETARAAGVAGDGRLRRDRVPPPAGRWDLDPASKTQPDPRSAGSAADGWAELPTGCNGEASAVPGRACTYPCRTARRHVRRLVAPALCAVLAVASGQPAAAGGGWRPAPGQRLDLQLTAPFDLVRRADALVLELFTTGAERVARLRGQGTAAVCRVAAGLWEGWRPDAASFPAAVLGRRPGGSPAERLTDVRAAAALRPILERRLDLCRERGFAGVLFTDADGHARASGFALTPQDQLAFNRWLAAAAHARGLAAGIWNDLAQARELAPAFDFLVADGCAAAGDCGGVRPYLAAGKAVFLVAYTNRPRRMDAHCAVAARAGAPLILKTRSLNGKLHRRCG
jgi:hypothetical protein